jgi:uncharacterized protein (DUF488 family)
MSQNFFTIGVYGSTEESFFDKLISNKIDTFCDIRNRRGVRGSKYSYVNSKKLQARLHELGIKYIYIPELAPTPEIRNVQKEADKKDKILKSSRQELNENFRKAFASEILDKFDFDKLIKDLFLINAKNVVLFCVEAEPRACHRSLVLDRLKSLFQTPVNNL